jgi:F0F1-type ATP synthase delta subunit
MKIFQITIIRTKQLEEMIGLKHQITELTKRYNTALIVIGEKDEQLEEMKADIKDLKQIYQTQINELLVRLESVSKK